MGKPIISVIIPAYNHERWLSATLESILEQTLTEWEVVLVDDGSTDGTLQIAKSYQVIFGRKLQILSQVNSGICRALNVGVRASRASLIAIIASDDVMLPQRLALQVEAFNANPNAAIIHGGVLRIDEHGNVIKDMRGSYKPARGACFNDFMFGRVGVCAPSIAFRRTLWEDLGGFNEKYHTEDMPFLLEATFRGYIIEYVNDPIACWRDTPGSIGKTSSWLVMESIALREHYVPKLPTELRKPALAYWHRYEFRMAALQGNWQAAICRIVESGCSGYLHKDLPHYSLSIAAAIARNILPLPLYRKLAEAFRTRIGKSN